MTMRHVCLLLAFASPMGFSGCKQDQAPAKDSGTPGTADAADAADAVTTADTFVAKCISIADDLIADFNLDSGSRLAQIDGRSGAFYVRGDNSIAGVFDPPAQVNYPIDTQVGNPDCSGPGSFHTKATGFGVWGAQVVANFLPVTDAGADLTYDASKYKGVSFWAKAGVPLNGVQVVFPDVYTDSAADPSVIDPSISACVNSTMQPAFNCSPYLVKLGKGDFPKYLDMLIDTNWKRFDIMFADTLQDKDNQGFHTAADVIDTQHLTGITIQVNAIYDAAGKPSPNDFEIWIDDVYFIR
jgi:hypothetical protein